jgi:hypothetical protein
MGGAAVKRVGRCSCDRASVERPFSRFPDGPTDSRSWRSDRPYRPRRAVVEEPPNCTLDVAPRQGQTTRCSGCLRVSTARCCGCGRIGSRAWTARIRAWTSRERWWTRCDSSGLETRPRLRQRPMPEARPPGYRPTTLEQVSGSAGRCGRDAPSRARRAGRQPDRPAMAPRCRGRANEPRDRVKRSPREHRTKDGADVG